MSTPALAPLHLMEPPCMVNKNHLPVTATSNYLKFKLTMYLISLQQPALYNSHLYTTAASPQ